MLDNSLKEIGDKHGTDKFREDVNYTNPYLKYFENIRSQNLKILEIGVARGAGLLTWNEYFENGKVFGMENWWKHSKTAISTIEKCKENGILVFTGNQSSRRDLSEMVSEFGSFNIIIDDGGHTMEQQQISLGFLFPFLESGGIYVIEDLVTSYPEFGNGFHRIYPEGTPESEKISTLNFLKDLESGEISNSPFMTENELEYIKDNLESCEVFENLGTWQPKPGTSWGTAMSIIVKR